MIDNTLVHPVCGPVRGRAVPGSTVVRFDAIPYAQAPEGELRFAPPQPQRWRDTLDATQPGPIAPQLPSRLREAMGDFDLPQSEDCLRLTVWTPGVSNTPRPVLVWLHGGAWQSGAGALPWYDGTRLAARGGMVVVAVNYRLAALGWAMLPDVTANLGLLDQEAALQWVVKNIEAFGGDPSDITVMGQSAGAGNAVALLARKPVFRRAILQSAPLGRPWHSRADAEALGAALLQAAGAHDLASARRVPVKAWLAAQRDPAVLQTMRERGMTTPFGPVADGEVLPETIELSQQAARMPTLIGYTADEMAAFPDMGRDEASANAGDALFGAPARQWAALAAEQGQRCWAYRFDYAPTERFGACHCIDLPFTFGTLSAFENAPMLAGMHRGQAEMLVNSMQKALVRFIHGDEPDWEPAPALHIFN